MSRRRAGRRHALDAARGQGAGVSGGLHRGARGGLPPARRVARGRGGARGRAPRSSTSGMTRAKDELTLTLAGRRLVYGKVQYRDALPLRRGNPAAALEQISAPRAVRPTIFEHEPEDEPCSLLAPRPARPPPPLRLRRHPRPGRQRRRDPPDRLLRPRRQEEVRRPLRRPDTGVRVATFPTLSSLSPSLHASFLRSPSCHPE